MGRILSRAALTAAVCFAFLTSGHTAQAQPVPKMPKFFGGFTPQEGVWSEYSVLDRDSGEKSIMRLAIVGRDGDGWWYEVRMGEGRSTNVIKMFVSGNPKDPENIRRLIVKSGEGRAIEMPRDFVVMGRKMAGHMFESRSGLPAESEGNFTVEDLGEREVSVPAGTFTATRRRVTGPEGEEAGTYDFSADVLPIGVVYSESERTSMELLAYGKDAKSMITEEPVPMEMPPGMTGPPGQGMMPPGMVPPKR